MNHLIAQIRTDFERRRKWFVVRHGERRAVRKHTARPAQTELADGEQVAFDLELREAPCIRAQRAGTAFDPGFEMPLLLLEMLGSQEEPFGPDDAVVL